MVLWSCLLLIAKKNVTSAPLLEMTEYYVSLQLVGECCLPSDNLKTFSTLRTVCCSLESVISNSCPKSSKSLEKKDNENIIL